VSQYQKGKTNLDFAEARNSEWQWHQLNHMQICISLETDSHASTPSLSFLLFLPSSHVKALKACCLFHVEEFFFWFCGILSYLNPTLVL